MSDERFLLVTMRVADCQCDVPHSIVFRCERCNSSVYVTPASQQLVARRNNLEIVCRECVNLKEWLRMRSQGVLMAPGSARELAAWMARSN